MSMIIIIHCLMQSLEIFQPYSYRGVKF